MKIYLIRHGETDWNHLNRFQGREDIPLNEAGIAQVAACGNALCHTGITAIYTSPLQRAFRTGEEIGRQTGLGAESVRPMEELRIIKVFEGLPIYLRVCCEGLV